MGLKFPSGYQVLQKSLDHLALKDGRGNMEKAGQLESCTPEQLKSCTPEQLESFTPRVTEVLHSRANGVMHSTNN